MIGKTVIMKVTSTTGATNVVQGRVDYIVKERGKLYLSIEDKLYSLDDLDKVIDDDYLDAVSIAEDFKKVVDELPDPKNLTLKDKSDLEIVRKAYNSLTTYQQQMIEKYYPSSLKKLQELVAKMKELDESSGSDNDSEDNKTDGENSGGDKNEETPKS